MDDNLLHLTAVGGGLSVDLGLTEAMNYALAHNGVSPIRELTVKNDSSEPIEGLQLELNVESPSTGPIAEPCRLMLPDLPAHDGLTLTPGASAWRFDPSAFARIDESVNATVHARFISRTRTLSTDGTMRLLAHNEWSPVPALESLAAFVTPNASAVRSLASDASDLLAKRTGSPSLQGYQGGADRAIAIATAIYDAMAVREIRYISPPPSFERNGQKIRTPHEVLVDRWGTCLDLAVTYAAGLEQAGLNPVIALLPGHAYCAYFVDEQQLREMVLLTPHTIVNYFESGMLTPVETTLLCAGDDQGAHQKARDAAYSRRGDVFALVDVAAAHKVIRPLPAISFEDNVRVVEVERQPARTAAPPPPPPAVGSAPSGPRGAFREQREFPPRISQWRNSLLDLSFRNPLLNMKTGRGSVGLHVPSGSLGTVEDMLFDGRSLNLIPHDQLAEIHLQRGARTAQDIEPDVLANLLGDGDLYIAVPQNSYLTRLRGLQRRARTVIEETGANNLFVTLGMLEWSDAGREARAPLFLVPVRIHQRRGRAFALEIDSGASAEPNQCLLEKLRESHGLTIPQFVNPEADASGIDLVGSLQAIRVALLEAGLPFSIEESAHIALLQFSTLQLWQDMSDNWESFLTNPVVRHLVETPNDTFTDPAAEKPLRASAEASAYTPIAVDGSQLEAVRWAEAGRSFVLEGPPGTGKSQTITNLIANAVANGQRVLFVAEKQAALEVVRRRLQKIGIGDLCLNLHGKSQTVEDVRQQLRTSLDLAPVSNRESWEAARSAYRSAVTSLSRYPVALHEAGGAGLSAWDARQSLLTVGEHPAGAIATTAVAQPLDTSALYAAGRELTDALYDLGTSLVAHHWRLSALTPDGLEANRLHLQTALTQLDSAVGALQGTIAGRLLDASPSSAAPKLVADWLDAVATAGWRVDPDCLSAASTPTWEAQRSVAMSAITTAQRDAEPLLKFFAPRVIESTQLDDLLERARTVDAKLFKSRHRKAIIAELDGVTAPEAQLDTGTLTSALSGAVALRAVANDARSQARALSGIQLEDDWNPLIAEHVDIFLRQADAVAATARLTAELPEATPIVADLSSATASADDATNAAQFSRAWAAVTRLLAATDQRVADWQADASLLAAVRGALPGWLSDARSGLVSLGRWSTADSLLSRLRAAGCETVCQGVLDGTVATDDIETALRSAVAQAALTERLSRPALTGFDGLNRDRLIERFERHSEELRRDMIQELPATVVRQRSFDHSRMVGRVGEFARELSRKRGGLRIRELFGRYGEVIAEVTPCLLMSPHSVARFLPAGAVDIDLVVFDEASQIRVAEAIGAMGRGKAAVVVGDSQQMPPSNMMSSSASMNEDEISAEGVPADMESVLTEAVKSKMPRLWLSWHYRSQHEALISFSNEHYYEGRLASFPRPPENRSDLGVHWRRVDGTFARGGERVNRVEAEAIIAEIRERLAVADASGATASLGVVTFNTQQRELILDLLEESGDERVAAALADEREPLFVKNLENVQGDERDVILFSLAFSPNRETGQLPLNFGPLIQAGGEKRLNVAVTRARTSVVLFSSFDPSQIDLSRSSSTGLAHLRAYMEMAQRSTSGPQVLRRARARDRHQEDIVDTLRDAGLVVREQIGMSDFTVDIAVAEHDAGPWVGVFLDGPSYAARATVADRETLPYGILRNLGWRRTVRVWLPDWVRDRDEVIGRIREALASIPEAPSGPVVAPPAVETASDPARGKEPAKLPSAADANPVSDVETGADLPLTAQMMGMAAPAVELAGIPEGNESRTTGTAPENAFVAANETHVASRETLDVLARDRDAQAQVWTHIKQVLDVEAPVESTRLARIVGRRFGLARVAAGRSAAILSVIPRNQVVTTPFGTFVWNAAQTPEDYELFRPSVGDPVRSVDEIAPIEILNAMCHLARTGLGISRDELIRETAAVFGYSRLAIRLRGHLEEVLDYGIGLRRLEQRDETINTVE
jgi:hypothetical protein